MSSERKINRKNTLLQAAKELFGECGYAETTFRKISDRAGVALGLLAHHYGSKEKLFLAAGLEVLENFYVQLQKAVADTDNGYEGVLNFCRAYLEFTISPTSSWLVLVRCSPYSDMKTKGDRDQMIAGFTRIHRLLEQELERGIKDGSVRQCSPRATAQVIVSLMVGANRTRVLTPYATADLYEQATDFVAQAIGKSPRPEKD